MTKSTTASKVKFRGVFIRDWCSSLMDSRPLGGGVNIWRFVGLGRTGRTEWEANCGRCAKALPDGRGSVLKACRVARLPMDCGSPLPLLSTDTGHWQAASQRSEEHTSELQSQSNLVC